MANTLSGTLTNLLSSRNLRSTFSFAESFRSRFGFRWWFLPLGILALVMVGLVANDLLERAIKQQKATELETLLNAEITALEVWFDSQKTFARVAGQDPLVREWVGQLAARAVAEPTSLATAPEQQLLSDYLRPLARAQSYIDFVITGQQGLVLAAGVPQVIGNPALTRHYQFLLPALGGEAMVSRPFRAEIPLPDESGEYVWGRPTMFVAAPVRDAAGEVVAALGLRIRPEVDFTRILHVARPGETGETYAFDVNGLMVSQSRFDADLREIGLLPEDPTVRAIFNVEIRDPGGDLGRGHTPDTPRPQQPLTRMAAAAVSGEDGIDVDGYRDYRGVEVVGAWRWLGDYGFGVATEIDADEAFAALHRVRWLFRALFGLVVLASLGTLGVSVSLARLGRRADAALQRARKLGQYTLEEEIGKGGMGQVYRASHALLRRPTAIKLLPPGRKGTEELARFEREVQSTSRLTHPNTVAVYDYGRTPDGLFYYAMEYLPGLPLSALVADYGPLPQERAAHFLAQIASSLAEAHAAGLVHRDVKPANVIICERGGIQDFVKVLDFGIVKSAEDDANAAVTRAGNFAGTPEYASPEQIRAEVVDARSDIYSLGALAYFLLAGEPVFSADSALEVCSRHLQDDPDSLSSRGVGDVDPALEALVRRCLAKRAAERFPDMESLRLALDDLGLADRWTQAAARRWWLTQAPDALAQAGDGRTPSERVTEISRDSAVDSNDV